MNIDGLTRRQINQLLAGGALLLAVGGIGGLTRAAHAQPGNRKAPPAPPKDAEPKSILDGVIKEGRSNDFILKPDVHISSYQEDTNKRGKNDTSPVRMADFAFTSAAVVFPVLHPTASSRADIDGLKSELKFDDKVVAVTPQFNDGYHSGVRLGRWELGERKGRQLDLRLEIPVTCWETLFDEKIAAKAVWPEGGKWPRVPTSTLAPQAGISANAEDVEAARKLVTLWTDGKSPQLASPLVLAKLLAGKVQENFQPSGQGENYSREGAFMGLELQQLADTVKKGTGSTHDITSLLVAVYRAAGIPTRLLIGYDQTAKKDNDSGPFDKNSGGGIKLKTWAEFCLFDATTNKEFWVPVDVVRMRKSGNKMGKLDQPWKFFGSHEELDAVIPFAHHYIPPTTVAAYGYAFWGWFTTPGGQIGEQSVRFTAQTAPKRAKPRNDKKDKKYGDKD